MEPSAVSAPALITAFARAYHATHDTPKIFDDYLAEKILTEDELTFFGETCRGAQTLSL